MQYISCLNSFVVLLSLRRTSNSSIIGGDRLQQVDRLPLGEGWGGVLLDAGGLGDGDVLGGLPGDEPLGRELLVGAAEDGQAPRDRRRGHAGFGQAALVELDVIGGDLQGCDALGLHVPEEVRQVAVASLDRVVRLQRVAHPGDQRRRDGLGVGAGGLQGAGQEGFDLGGGRGIAVEEVAPFGHQASAGGGGRQGREAGAVICTKISVVDGFRRGVHFNLVTG